MFERVYPATRPTRAFIPAPLGASLLIHAVFFASVAITVPGYVTETLTEGIQYLAPLPVHRQEVRGEGLTFIEFPGGGDAGEAIGALDVLGEALASGSQGKEAADTVGGAGAETAAAFAELPKINLDSIYFPEEVDNPAAYDPRSRAPAYPDSLQRLGIEGYVTAQFVVDTNGRAADTSLRIIDSTHVEFARSVRSALPGMLFRPAELRGERIRQLVQQTFSFRIPAKSADSANRAPLRTQIPPHQPAP